MRKGASLLACATVAIICLFISVSTWGQATTTLHGAVTDPSGAAVPNAKVTLTNQATNVPRETTTTSSGEYNFASVLPGTYKLTVEKDGFNAYVQTGLLLQVNLPVTEDVKLQVGGMTQTVEVKGQAPLLNTTNATLGQTMDTSAIENLPLSQENTVLLLSLQPGVVYNGDSLLTDDYDTRAGSVNGERSDQNNITLDGVSNNNEFEGYAFNGILPTTPFSVEEFRVTTSNYGATEGRSSGAQIAMVTKGGTNQFHGSLYEFNRNTLGEANDYFLKSAEAANGQPNIPEHLVWNNYGGTIGGPILKDRFFFFFNYEGHRQSVGESVERIIPSSALRDGVIQYACATASQCPGGTVQGATQTWTVQPGNFAIGPNSNSSGTASGLAAMDPLGVGPSPVMMSYFNTFPQPNDLNTLDSPNFAGYRFAAPTLTKDNWYIGRLDYKLTENGNHTLFARGEGIDDRLSGAEFLPGNNCPLNPGKPCLPESTNADLAKGFIIGYTGVFGPHWVNNFRYGLTRDSFGSNGDTNVPWVFVRDMDSGVNYSNGDTAPVHNIIDTLSWQKGSHNFQFGVNLLLSRLNTWSTQGSFSDALTNADWIKEGGFANKGDAFDPATAGYPVVAGNFNHSYDFPLAGLLGMASEVDGVFNYKIANATTANEIAQGGPIYRHWATGNYNIFFEDTWQALPTLSVSYGLNYQLMTPMTETAGQEVTPSVNMGTWFSQRFTDMLQGIPDNQVNGGNLIGFSPAGSSYGKPGLYSKQTKNFAPRIGLAWSPRASGGILERIFGDGKSVVRAGAGMYYDNFGPELALTYSGTGEFGLSTGITNRSATLTLAQAPRITSMNVIPTTESNGTTPIINPPASSFTFPSVPAAGSFFITHGIDQSLKTPYSYALDLSLERQLPGQLTMDVAYVGHLAHRLLVYDDIATPMDLVDPATHIDYFAAATQLSKMWRQGVSVNDPNLDSKIGPTAAYWQDILAPQSSYPLCLNSGGTTTDLLQAVYANAGPQCGDLYNETGENFDFDVAGYPTAPKTGLFSMYNSQYSSLWDWRSIGWSNFNALEVSLRKQMSNGLLFGFNYTYSHSNDVESMSERGVHYLTDSVINPWNIRQMYASSDFDLRHQINAYWVAQLPFGRGQYFAKDAGGWENELIGGWQVSGTIRWASGFPVSVFQGYVWPTNWDEMGWSDLTGSPILTGTTLVNESGNGIKPNIFRNAENCSGTGNPCAANGFDYAFPGESGARNPIRGDGYFGWDMNLQKAWALPRLDALEDQALQMRWSVFNVANAHRFDAFSMQDEWDAGSFGTYSSTLTSPRVMELALIYQF
jgi:hypothetical protein